jgi:curved DNA-binding protein CbpA
MPREWDPYAVLRVGQDADAAAIRRAYKARMRALHPDRAGASPHAAAEMEAVKRAYDRLADPQARAEEDRALSDDPLLAWLSTARRRVVATATADSLYNDDDAAAAAWHAVDIHNRNGNTSTERAAARGQEVAFDVHFLPL